MLVIFYIGIGCMIIFTLKRFIYLKKVLDKKIELKDVDKYFLSRVNNWGDQGE